MKYNIPFIKPSFPEEHEIAKDYSQIVDSNWFTNFGPYEQEFRARLEEYVGNDVKAVTFNNATIGLLAAIEGLIGRGNGKEYIAMPSFTFIAGAQAIIWAGYKPYFVDIDSKSLQMDVNNLENVIDEVKGVLFCNVFGIGNPDMEAIEEIATKNSKPLVVDSAAGFGSKYIDGTFLGNKGDCEVFSFHATKPFAIGEGGAILTKDIELAKRLKKITNFGFGDSRDAEELGFNGKLQEFNAAIGILQLKKLDAKIASRQDTYSQYASFLENLGFKAIDNAENSSLGFAPFVCPEAIGRNGLVRYLNINGIQAREYYNPPIHRQSYFVSNRNQWADSGLDNTENVCDNIFSLPIHDDMRMVDVESVLSEIGRYAKDNKRA